MSYHPVALYGPFEARYNRHVRHGRMLLPARILPQVPANLGHLERSHCTVSNVDMQVDILLALH
jgi:hypothetical protein